MNTLVQTKIESSVKIGAERILNAMGMSLEDGAVVSEPNEDTLNAVRRVNERVGLKKMSLKEFENMLDK
jgi:antitoxin component of RelBE/YafQ-DinJ toxin-antitoxin module